VINHTTQDTLSRLNMPYYTELVKAAVGSFAHLTNCLLDEPPPATLTYSAWMNDGAHLSGQMLLHEDGTFEEGENAGIWSALPNNRLFLRYQAGQQCNAIMLGKFVNDSTQLRGLRLCTDGSGTVGIWLGLWQ